MQWHTTFTVPFSTSDLSTAKTARQLNFNTFSTRAHAVLYRALHRTTEHNATLKLAADTISDQTCIKIRWSDFFNVDLRRYAHNFGQFFLKSFDIFAFLTDNNTRTRSGDGNLSSTSRTLNHDIANHSII